MLVGEYCMSQAHQTVKSTKAWPYLGFGKDHKSVKFKMVFLYRFFMASFPEKYTHSRPLCIHVRDSNVSNVSSNTSTRIFAAIFDPTNTPKRPFRLCFTFVHLEARR